jgi:hypothetical protein
LVSGDALGLWRRWGWTGGRVGPLSVSVHGLSMGCFSADAHGLSSSSHHSLFCSRNFSE